MSQGTEHPCLSPLDAGVLADYWRGATTGTEEDTIETHLLECGACSGRLHEIAALDGALQALVRDGRLRVVVGDAFLQRAEAEGLQVRHYDVPIGGSVQCTVTEDDDFLIARLAVEPGTAGRVDMSCRDSTGAERLRLVDIPVQPGADSVVFQESIAFAKASPSETMVVCLLGVNEEGDERLLGEYTFNHTRSLPGPGAW